MLSAASGPRRFILAIEASNPSAAPSGSPGGGVAIGTIDADGARVLTVEPISPASRHDDDLLPAIERARARAGIQSRDIARVGVSIGPGGFTALRISIAASIMIAEALGAELVGVPSALVAARRVRLDGRPFAVALSSKNDSAYIVGFDPHGVEHCSGRVCRADDLPAFAAARLIADSFLPDSFRTRATEQGIGIEHPTFDPAACLELSARMPPTAPASLRPVYPREPEAVTLWKQRRG